jgi:hypothetical protein
MLPINNPTESAIRASVEDRDEAIRREAREADRALLQILAEKKARLQNRQEDRNSPSSRLRYVNKYKAQVLDTINSVGPEARPLVEDLRRRAEDPDFQAVTQ